MSNKKDCIVVIPVYKTLEVNDRIAISQAVDMTPSIDKVFIMPENFVVDESFTGFSGVSVERFDDCFFASTSGYNRLMLNVDFYKRFSDYKYMLIHQTDAFLFKPDLPYWCSKNYDYIGAPWFRPYKIKIKKEKLYSFVLAVCPWIYSPQKRRTVRYYNRVGNGGLSLRRIDTFIKILESAKAQRILRTYLEKQVSDPLYNEDVFWSFEGHRLHKKFKKPSWQEAIYFSLEAYPSFSYNLMKKQLPFGCHAPLVHGTEFWKDHVPFVQTQKQPLISIICVTYNAASCISACIDSIIEQRCAADIELIIIDGNSTDGTQDILKKYGDKIAFWKSEPDEGVYDAMNKALEHIRGRWVYFIGADDRLSCGFSFFVENELRDERKIYYASVLWKGIRKKGFLTDYKQAKEGIFHQAIIYPASVFKKYSYNTGYPVSADYALNLRLHGDNAYKFEFRDYIIAYFNHTGISSHGPEEAFLRDKRRLVMENFGIGVRIRYILHEFRKKTFR